MNMSNSELTKLKFEMISAGVRVSKELLSFLKEEGYKLPKSVRSGASGGLELTVSGKVHVNAPIIEPYARESELGLIHEGSEFWVIRKNEKVCQADISKRPEYYALTTSDGVAMNKIGQMCYDRLGIGVVNACSYVAQEKPCKFCAIKNSADNDLVHKSIEQILETLDAAVNDPIAVLRHILLSGGTLNNRDKGAKIISQVAREIKKKYDFEIYTMLVPPESKEYVDLVYDSGITEVAYNIEIWQDSLARKIIPAKAEIGKEKYLKTLEYAVQKFGPINTRTLFVVGLEPIESLVEGVRIVSDMGVMPILSIFRAQPDTDLENCANPSQEYLLEAYVRAREVLADGIPLGPTCVPCQSNCLVMPFDNEKHHFY